MVEIERRPGHVASVVFSVRFSRDEIALIRQAVTRLAVGDAGLRRMVEAERQCSHSGNS